MLHNNILEMLIYAEILNSKELKNLFLTTVDAPFKTTLIKILSWNLSTTN